MNQTYATWHTAFYGTRAASKYPMKQAKEEDLPNHGSF